MSCNMQKRCWKYMQIAKVQPRQVRCTSGWELGPMSGKTYKFELSELKYKLSTFFVWCCSYNVTFVCQGIHFKSKLRKVTILWSKNGKTKPRAVNILGKKSFGTVLSVTKALTERFVEYSLKDNWTSFLCM